MKQHVYFCLVALLLLLYSCDYGDQKQGTNAPVSLRQEWFPNCNYAGAVFAKKEFAKEYNLELTIEQGSDQIDPVNLVIQGHNTFGDASADKVLMANEKGADLVIIGVVSYNSPTCFIAKEESNIRTPQDFEGKTVGILTGTNTEYIYRTLIRQLKLNEKKIKEVEAPFDLNSFVTANAYDVRPAYIYDEPVSLDQQNIKYTIIEPKNYGIHFLGTVYFTRRETIEKQREMVQSFVNAIADGWKAAIKYPERAIDLLKEYDGNVDVSRELACFYKGSEYFKGKDGKILWADMSDWEKMVQEMHALGLVGAIDVSRSVDNSFLSNYYNSSKEKISAL